METSLVRIRARIAHVLLAIRLGKEDSQADTTRDFGIRCIEPFRSRDSDPEGDNILERGIGILGIRGRRLHDAEEIHILLEKRLIVGIEVSWRKPEFIRPADFRRKHVGEVLIGAYHVVAREIERLSRQVRQRLF